MTKFFLIIFVCLFQLPCNFGKDMSGKIVDTEGKPVDGATLKLFVWDQKRDDAPSKTIETTTTDKNGKFGVDFGGENPDTKLVLDIEKEGFRVTILKFTPLLVQKNEAVFKDYQVILEKK